jgi:predicted metal-binding membrane protein
MNGMSMSHHGWTVAAAGYLGMWMTMMVPMMLPSLVPMLVRYRRTVRDVDGRALLGLTAVVSASYFVVWGGFGVLAFAFSHALIAAESRWGGAAGQLPIAVGAVLLAAGVVQLSPWKSRQLVRCRQTSRCDLGGAADASGAWRHGVRLGLQCGLCCSGLMMALLAVGMMNPFAMVLVTLAITAERLAPAPQVVARVAGLTIMMVALATVVRT